MSLPHAQSPFSFDLGKSLQLLQSVLLIITFIWAARERKRYRIADRFSKMGIEFVANSLDGLYDDVYAHLEALRSNLKSRDIVNEDQIEAINFFRSKLFQMRTIVIHRLSCFPHIDLGKVDELFSDMEDSFTVGAGSLDEHSKHPKLLAADIGKDSATIMSILMSHEMALSRNRLR